MSTSATVATCIGCGCDDDHACVGGCSWVRIDRIACVGVCAACLADVPRWDAGDRSMAEDAPLDGVDLEDMPLADDDAGLILPGDYEFDATLQEMRAR